MKNIIFLVMVAFVFSGCASGPTKQEPKFDFHKSGVYYLNNVSVKISGDDKVKDDKETFNSVSVLRDALYEDIKNNLNKQNKISSNPEASQAILNVELSYKRNYLFSTSRRLPPIMNYNIDASKDGKNLGKYSSEKLTGFGTPFTKLNNADELGYIQKISDKIVEIILSAEK